MTSREQKAALLRKDFLSAGQSQHSKRPRRQESWEKSGTAPTATGLDESANADWEGAIQVALAQEKQRGTMPGK